MTVEKEAFLKADSSESSFMLMKLTKEDEIQSAANLLWEALQNCNQKQKKKLYRQSLEKEQQFLAEISELYGVYDKNAGNWIAMIAVEEDSVERIAVVKEYQRQGIGRALMHFACEKLSATYVDVYADNLPALRFFESCGLSMFDETAPEPGDLMAEDPHKIIHLMY